MSKCLSRAERLKFGEVGFPTRHFVQGQRRQIRQTRPIRALARHCQSWPPQSTLLYHGNLCKMGMCSIDGSNCTKFMASYQTSMITSLLGASMEVQLVRCLCSSNERSLMQLCVALMRDTSKVVALSRSSTPFAKNEIRVYSSSGEGVLSFSVLPIYLCSYRIRLMH